MGIKIKNSEFICEKGSGKFNEDVVGVTPFGAWLLDGATGLNGKNLVSKESDAKWYVNWWNQYLYKNLSKDEPLKEIIKDGIDKVAKEYREKVGNIKIDKLDTPSCSSVIIKYHEEKVEYCILGDCTVIFSRGKDIDLIKDDTVSKLDDKVYSAMNNVCHKSFKDKKNTVRSEERRVGKEC